MHLKLGGKKWIADVTVPNPMHLKGALEVKEYFFYYKYPQTPKKILKKYIWNLEHFFGQILSLFLSKFSPKYINKPLISLFSQQSRGSVLALFFLSLVFAP